MACEQLQDDHGSGCHVNVSGLVERFIFKEVLSNDYFYKKVVISGTIKDDELVEHDAVLIIRKLPFDKENVEKVPKSLKFQKHVDSVGRKYKFLGTLSNYNGYTGTLVYPATEKIIDKYRFRPVLYVVESYQLYLDCIFPQVVRDIESKNRWIQKIFDGEAEKDRILYRHNDHMGNFVILPDLKWDGKNIKELYILMISGDTSLYSIRELTGAHIPMLKLMKCAILGVLKTHYGLEENKAKIYAHYQPSFWQFHLHVVSLGTTDSISDRNIMLDTILNDLAVDSNYYQKSSMVLPVIEGSFFYNCYKDRL